MGFIVIILYLVWQLLPFNWNFIQFSFHVITNWVRFNLLLWNLFLFFSPVFFSFLIIFCIKAVVTFLLYVVFVTIHLCFIFMHPYLITIHFKLTLYSFIYNVKTSIYYNSIYLIFYHLWLYWHMFTSMYVINITIHQYYFSLNCALMFKTFKKKQIDSYIYPL